MKRIALLVGALGVMMLGLVTIASSSPHSHAAICNSTVPLGALAPATPEWCHEPLAAGIDTHSEGANSWLDDFDHGQTHAALSGAYVSGDFGVADSIFFQHNNHWMVDIQAPGGVGGAWMRPNRSFLAENGKLVFETEVAPSIATYDNSALGDFWPEVVFTTAPAPTFARPDALYLYDQFANNWTFGCRLQRDGSPTCALFNNSAGGAGSGGRVWEASWFQCPGTDCSGGATWAAPGAWKFCSASDDPDALCRNKYRFEITTSSFTIYVNGQQYMRQTGLSSLGNLLSQPLYVYNGSIIYQFGGSGVLRAHWDHLAVNPESNGGSTPTPTPTSANTPTPTATSATPTPTAATYRCQVRNANGTWTTLWRRQGGGSCP